MPHDLLVQIKFMMDGYAHQILVNQRAMMDYMVGAEFRADTDRMLTQRIHETDVMLEQLKKRTEL